MKFDKNNSRLILCLLFVIFSFQTYAKHVTPSTKIVDLVVKQLNGNFFGPAVLGSNGIEIRKTILQPADGGGDFGNVLLRGSRCSISAGNASDYDWTLDIGHHYGIFSISEVYGFIQATNMYHFPRAFFVNCPIDDNLTVGEVEEDLYHAIKFY